MKKLSYLIFVFAFVGLSQSVAAQNTNQPDAAPGRSPVFEIFVDNTEEAVRWYIEPHAVSNELGEAIFRVDTDARTALMTRLKDLQDDTRLSTFELSPDQNRLTISMPNKGRDVVMRELESMIRN